VGVKNLLQQVTVDKGKSAESYKSHESAKTAAADDYKHSAARLDIALVFQWAIKMPFEAMVSLAAAE